MVLAEALVVRAVSRLVDVENGHDETRLLTLSTNTTRRLDVLRVALGLSKYHHES